MIQSEVIRIQVVSQQYSQEFKKICLQHDLTTLICGYITLSITQLLANNEEKQLTAETIKEIVNENTIKNLLPKVMVFVNNRRILEVQQYGHLMKKSQKQYYFRQLMATYQLSDYLEALIPSLKNKQIYVFRQVSYDHPKLLKELQYEEAKRAYQQQIFKGQKYYYTSYQPQSNHFKSQFIDQLKSYKINHDLPIIIPTHHLGHFNTIILFKKKMYILESRKKLLTDEGIIKEIKKIYDEYLTQSEII